jgi:fused signal recognition particle receptor
MQASSSNNSFESIDFSNLWIIAIALLILALIGLLLFTKKRKKAASLTSEKRPIAQASMPSVPSIVEKNAEETVTHPARPTEISEILSTDEKAWLSKLKAGLNKTRNALQGNIKSILFNKSSLDEETLEKLHETLYRADIGPVATDNLTDKLRTQFKGKSPLEWPEIREAIKSNIIQIFKSVPNPPPPTARPLVMLIAGVNGVGKTTTIGKLSAHFLAKDQTVLLCAADTFRAAAIDQLQIWANRLNVEMIRHQPGSDPAAVVFDAVKAAQSRSTDVLIIDTAGRLHNKVELMEELKKIERVISREIPGAPHEIFLVLDATTGQNAVQQIKSFKEFINITGLIITKLDGTAKGGVVIGIEEQYKIPIRYIGVGEKASDLREFRPEDFVEILFNDE